MSPEIYLKEKRLLIEYLKMKVDNGDWHGVADAAMDIREIDAKISMLKPKND